MEKIDIRKLISTIQLVLSKRHTEWISIGNVKITKSVKGCKDILYINTNVRIKLASIRFNYIRVVDYTEEINKNCHSIYDVLAGIEERHLNRR
jgi:hypothetical protein